MKKCNRCGLHEGVVEFGSYAKAPDGKQYSCKECLRAYHRNIYTTSPGRKEKIREVDRRYKRELRDKVDEYKSKVGCADCGEKNPIVLDFDHLRDKEFDISKAVNSGYAWERILREIDKCEVVCSNHHRIRTHERRLAGVRISS